MIIIQKLDEYLFDLFPKAKKLLNDKNVLKDEIAKYYTFGPYVPKVTIGNDIIEIEIDIKTIASEQKDFDKVVFLCEKRKYEFAKPILSKLIRQNPSISDYHRIMGQILSDEGQQEKAIDCLIDALKWNPNNSYALLLMGNILAKYKNEIPSAMKYYDLALANNVNDHIALNNIGANLLQLGKFGEGKRYLEMAFEINPDYPNTSYGLALAYEHTKEYLKAFEFAII